MVRIHPCPNKKDNDFCYYPFYIGIWMRATVGGSSASELRAKVFCKKNGILCSKNRRPVKRERARQSTPAQVLKDSKRGLFCWVDSHAARLSCRLLPSKRFWFYAKPILYNSTQNLTFSQILLAHPESLPLPKLTNSLIISEVTVLKLIQIESDLL